MNNLDATAVRDELQTVFRDVFGDDELVLTDAMTAADVPGWDSLAHLDLMIATQKRFGIKFATAEVASIKGEGQNIGTLVSLIERKLSAKR